MCFVMVEIGKPRTKLEKKLYNIWCSYGKRFKVSRFKCDFCGSIKKGSSYSVVDGVKSCLLCDEKYSKN